MAPKKQKANYGALFNTTTTLPSGAFSRLEGPASAALTEEDMTTVQMLPLEMLLDNPYQPRSSVDEEGLQQLTLTIQDQGFQGVLVARPDPTQPGMYQITAGHRRREAARRARLVALPVVVKDFTDQDMAVLAVTENIQREDLTSLDEGRLFCIMMDSMGMTLEQVAEAVKKSESYVRNRRRVAMAPEDIQHMVMKKPDSLRAVFYLLKVDDETKRAAIIDLILQGKLTADEVDQYVKALEHQSAGQREQYSHESDTPRKEILEKLPASTVPVEKAGTSSALRENLAERTLQEVPSSTTPPPPIELVVFEKQTLVGVSKLKTLLKAMKTYAEIAVGQQSLSAEEAKLIDQIIETAQQIRHTSIKQ